MCAEWKKSIGDITTIAPSPVAQHVGIRLSSHVRQARSSITGSCKSWTSTSFDDAMTALSKIEARDP